MADPFFGTTGPKNAKIAFVLESWGEQERNYNSSLVGPTGIYFNKFLASIGISRKSVFVTNVVMEQPFNNEMFRFFHKGTSGAEYKYLYPMDNVLEGIENLKIQLAEVNPDVVVACGNYAAWALTDDCINIANGKNNSTGWKIPAGIENWRGSQVRTSPEFGNRKCLLSLHPSNAVYPNESRFLFEHDIAKRLPLAFPPHHWDEPADRELEIDPSYDRCTEYLSNILHLASTNTSPVWLSSDIETFAQRFVSCIGFSASLKHAICIPFFRSFTQKCFTNDQELHIKLLIRQLLLHPNVKLVGQNFFYDSQYLERVEGVCYNRLADHDTMSVEHLLHPGLPKDLGYLSSIYCAFHRYWKEDKDIKIWNPKTTKVEDLWTYNCRDCLNTLEIALRQDKLLTADPTMRVLYERRKKINLIAYKMSRRGIRVREDQRRKLIPPLREAINSRIEFLDDMVPNAEHFPEGKSAPWWASPAKKKIVFYRWLKLKPVTLKRSKRGPSTETFGWRAIEALIEKYSWLISVLRPLAELGSLKNVLQVLEGDNFTNGRLYTRYFPDGPETFRFASKKPDIGKGTNLQNLTGGTE